MTKTTKKLVIDEEKNEEYPEVNNVASDGMDFEPVPEVKNVEQSIEKVKRTKKDRSDAQKQAFEKCLKARREKAELQKIKKQQELKHKK